MAVLVYIGQPTPLLRPRASAESESGASVGRAQGIRVRTRRRSRSSCPERRLGVVAQTL